ncbi:MAG: hypothetical protein Q9195_007862 [Heterodermia aff. obscurata]
MQILTIFAVLTGVCAQLASATCFHKGEHWGSHADAKAKLNDACGAMAGVFPAGKTKSECRDGIDFKAFNFELQNKKNQRQFISREKCVEYIQREIDNCGRGGEETIGGIRVRGDPNKGRC